MAMRFHGFQKGQIGRQNGGSILVMLPPSSSRSRFRQIMSNEQATNITLRRVLSTISRLFFEMEYKLASPKEIGYDENHEPPIGMVASFTAI
mmetsp:Transcript_21671/g.39771  ORF Transcript_21671/g.39771 Transcript_21671/m.39771 type:complete len:92 (+) Transcript_21671:1117-1392(+)